MTTMNQVYCNFNFFVVCQAFCEQMKKKWTLRYLTCNENLNKIWELLNFHPTTNMVDLYYFLKSKIIISKIAKFPNNIVHENNKIREFRLLIVCHEYGFFFFLPSLYEFLKNKERKLYSRNCWQSNLCVKKSADQSAMSKFV